MKMGVLNHIAFVAYQESAVNIIKKQLNQKNRQDIDVLSPNGDTTKYKYVEYNVQPNKEYGEILDLAGLVSRHGFHDEVYNPPIHGDKTALVKEAKRLEAPIIEHIVGQEPTYISREIVDVKLKELERQEADIDSLTVDQMSALYDTTTNLEVACELAYRINERIRGSSYRKDTPQWAIEPALQMLEDFPEYRTRLIKTFKTRMKNIVKDGKKLAAIRYFDQWLREQTPYSFKIDIDDEEIPF